jgi:hypothetical protein
VVPGGIQSEALLDDQITQPIATHQKTPSMKTNTASLLRKLALCLSASVLTLTANAAVTVNYQQDFSTFVEPGNNPAVNGWQFPWNDGFAIRNEGTDTGNVLWHVGGFSHAFTSLFSGNETQITVQSLMWPQVGFAAAGLTSVGFNQFTSGPGAATDQWWGFGPRMRFEGGNFSLQRGGEEGGGTSSSVLVSGATVHNANFSMVIDITTGLANGYFGTPEAGTLLISGFDLKGTSSLSTWKDNMLSMENFYVTGNQAIHDNLAVTSVLVPEPSTYALVLGGIATLLLIRRRVQS